MKMRVTPPPDTEFPLPLMVTLLKIGASGVESVMLAVTLMV